MKLFKKPEAPKTFKQAMIKGVVQGGMICVSFALAFGFASGMQSVQADMGSTPDSHSDVMDDRPEVKGSPVALVEKHDCWTGEAPADMEGKMPEHVVVTVKGEAKYAGSVMVGKALEQIFEGADYGLTVHGFCR